MSLSMAIFEAVTSVGGMVNSAPCPFIRSYSACTSSEKNMAAGWHISFDVLEGLLAGYLIGRIVGAEAMKFAGWQRLKAEYAKQFGVDSPQSS